MLIIFMVSTNVLLWTFSQNAIYTQAVKDENQKFADKLNENVIASNGNYSVLSGGRVKVETRLTNAGSVAAQIINLWVFDTSIQTYNYTSLNLNLNPGNVTDLTGSNAIVVTVYGADSTHDFISWFVTARGNTIPLEQEQRVIIAELAQGIGSLSLDFYTFRYFTYETGPTNKLKNYTEGNVGFNVPSGTDIAFGIVLTNLDPSKQTITLDLNSQVWVYFPKAPGQNRLWHVVNVAPDGTVTIPYSSITITYGETKLIVFATETPGGFKRVSIGTNVEDLCALNLLLHGTIGTQDYGQNIPFVSLYIYKPS